MHDILEWWMGRSAHSTLGGVGHGEGDHGLLLNLYHGNSYLYGPANLPCVHPDYDIRLPLQYFRGHAYSMSLGLNFYVHS